MTLYINCCVREESRTNRLARAVLKKLGGDFTEVKLYEENLRPLDRETLNQRTALIEQGDYSDKLFDYAKQFAGADTIVIAAPYWDLSFPAPLKTSISRASYLNMTKTDCRAAYAGHRSFFTSPRQADRMIRPTATAISRALPRAFSAFPLHIW